MAEVGVAFETVQKETLRFCKDMEQDTPRGLHGNQEGYESDSCLTSWTTWQQLTPKIQEYL